MTTLPPALPPGPTTNEHGFTSTYVSPYGHVVGLRKRITEWHRRMRRDFTLPWAGLGICSDLEVVVQLLNVREFAEWLRTHGPAEHRQFADDILDNEDRLEDFGEALGHGRGGPSGSDPVKEVTELVDAFDAHERLLKAVKDATNDEFGDDNAVKAVQTLATESAEAAAMRAVLVETGALDAGDVTTDTAALLRALLS